MSERPAKKKKLHKEKHKSRQYKVISVMKQEVFDILSRNNFSAGDAVNFLHDVEKDLDHVPKDLFSFREVVKDQFNQLSQPGKRSLISNLTHSRDGELNDEMLDCLPFLRTRSEKLLANPDRKERNDKIDVNFISDFMHDYCR